MEAIDTPRRQLLTAIAGWGAAAVLSPVSAAASSQVTPTVLHPEDGEHLVHFRDGGELVIYIGLATGTGALSLGSQQVKQGTGIPLHRHPDMTEVFSVLEGSGTVRLDDRVIPCQAGDRIVIPPGTWHAFDNPGSELRLQWITSPAGLDGFFRETCSPPGAPPKQLTHEQIRRIALRYHTEFAT